MGLASVTIYFESDDGEPPRDPIQVIVKDEGGTMMTNRAAFIKAREELPASETELYELLTRAIAEARD